MQHLNVTDNPRYQSCSELVSVLYEDRQKNVHQTTANLEDISGAQPNCCYLTTYCTPIVISFCAKTMIYMELYNP